MKKQLLIRVDEKIKSHFQASVGPGKMTETIIRFMEFNDLEPFDYAVLAGFLEKNKDGFIDYAETAQMERGDAEKLMHNVWRCAK